MASFIITLDTGGITGLVGTVGYAIYNADDTIFKARTVEGVSEVPPLSGCYDATVEEDDIRLRKVVWDTGGVEPQYASESFPEDLSAYNSTLTLPRSIRFLANQAHVLYPKADLAIYRILVMDAWREFVTACGNILQRTVVLEVPTPGLLRMPSDYRSLLDPPGVAIIDDANQVISFLTLITAEKARGYLATTETAGTPSMYYMANASMLGVFPTGACRIRVTYDAHVSDSASMDNATLDIPASYDAAIRDRAIAAVAELNGDFPLRNIYMAKFTAAITRFRDSISQRRHVSPVSPPYIAGRPA